MALRDFSEADWAVLKQVVTAVKSGRITTIGRPESERAWVDGADHQAPETYVAKTPSGGIPALTEASPDEQPGSATCSIYLIREDSITGVAELVRVTNLDKIVYNLTTDDIAGDTWITVTRTKFGKWMAMVSGASICNEVRFRINSVDQVPVQCPWQSAVVDILARPCGCTTVPEEVGTGTADTIRVFDEAGCFLDEPAADLVNRIGYAKYMIDEERVAVAPGTGTGTGTVAGSGDCRWEITQLCCNPGICT